MMIKILLVTVSLFISGCSGSSAPRAPRATVAPARSGDDSPGFGPGYSISQDGAGFGLQIAPGIVL